MPEAHLVNAARTLERLLGQRHPQYAFSVRVREVDGVQPHGLPPTLRREAQVDAVSDDTDPIGERGPGTPAAASCHDDAREEAA